MKFKVHTNLFTGEQTVYIVESSSWTNTEHPDFVAWLAEGNTPEEWSPDAS